jgi:polyferredoxin
MEAKGRSVIQLLFLGVFGLLIWKGNMGIWLGILGISIVLSLFFGRFYCGYICPMSPVMGWAEKVSRKIGLQRKKIPDFLMKDFLPWLVLAAMVGSMLAGRRALGIDIPVLLILIGISAVVTLFYQQELFHRYLCPYSGFLKMAGSRTGRSKGVNPQFCNGCRNCLAVCPAGAISIQPETKRAVINPAHCHQCSECSDVCPKDAIAYRKAG